MTTNQPALTRRQLLVRTGWLTGGVTLLGACDWLPALPTFANTTSQDTLTWLQLTPSGRFIFYCPRAEMGQGIATSLATLIAEELQIPLSDIVCRYPRTDQIPATRLTVGSQSMQLFHLPTARLAANLREVMRERLANHETMAVDQIQLASGGFINANGEHFNYRDLVAPREDTVMATELLQGRHNERARLLSQDPVHQNRVVGKFANDHAVQDIVTGRQRYSSDVGLRNMQFGRIARPPFVGARLLACEPAVEFPEGVVQVRGPSGEVGVVGPTPMAASAGLAALNLQWQPATEQQQQAFAQSWDIDAAIAADELDHNPAALGQIESGANAATTSISIRFDSPMVAHAALEPRSGTARVTNDVLEIWAASQDPWLIRNSVARLLRWPREKIIVHTHRIGGAFGGRALCQAAVEAAWLAVASQRTVKVQWNRSEELRYNYVGPAFSHRIDCGVTLAGEISHWHHRLLGAPILTSSSFVPQAFQAIADLVPDPGTKRGTQLPYRCANLKVEFADRRSFMPTGPWRGLGAAPNAFATECAMDELAIAAQTDPLKFRLDHITQPRLAAVARTVAKRCAWHRQLAPQSAFGIALAAYKDETFVAIVAQVRIIKDTATLTRLWCVQDCGQVIAPDQVQAQVEGNLVWGISMARHESYHTANGLGVASNFDGYPIARQHDIPPMDIHLLDSNQPPTGAGEAALIPTAAAIANAYARATGQRIRQLPFNFAVIA